MSRAVLVIGGSDSSGGAGIQADLRALGYLRIPAYTAVTAVTAQGPDGLTSVSLVDPAVITDQINEAFRSNDIAAVKIGMLGSAKQVSAVAKALKDRQASQIVLDPVLATTAGNPLLNEAGKRALLAQLLPMAAMVTPNLEELATLTNLPAAEMSERVAAAVSLLEKGAKSVLIKGGHLAGNPDDFLIEPGAVVTPFPGVRVLTEHTRGTGCLLASLIVGHLVRDQSLWLAVNAAKQDLSAALRETTQPAQGKGHPLPGFTLSHDDRLQKISGIYFVSDATLNPEITHAIGVRLALDGGANVVQLREKGYGVQDLVRLAQSMRSIATARGGLFIVNDRVDVAIASDADGVHLGPDDMFPQHARHVLGTPKIIGASVGTLDEAVWAAEFASYLAVGAIFGSSTKGDAGEPVGLERLREIRAAHPDKRIVAIGGINLSNIASVAEAGADAAAVVSAIVCAEDPVAATRALAAEFERGRAARKM